MKFKTAPINEEMKKEIIDAINQSDDKGTAIYEAAEKIAAEKYRELADQIEQEAQRAEHDKEFRESLGLRTAFSENEKKFYDMVKEGAKAFQSVAASQIDIIPTEIIDRTMADIRTESKILSLINFAPAGVKKWLFGGYTGKAVWGNLTSSITSELTATITGANMDTFKCSAFILVPKGIRDLEIGYVDRYVRAVLGEVLRDGLIDGYLNGDGVTAPIGITKQIGHTETNGKHSDKAKVTLKNFSPSGMKAAMKVLVHGGKRAVSQVYLLCNPLDEVEYVNPALYGDSVQAGFVKKAGYPLEVISDAAVTKGDAVLTIEGAYTMGYSGFNVTEYKETKALDDVDVIIGKLYANGRADDDDVAVVFDVTKLEEYKLPAQAATAAVGG